MSIRFSLLSTSLAIALVGVTTWAQFTIVQTKAPINFHVMNPGQHYRGARLTTPEEINYLSRLKVRTIINLQGGDPSTSIIGPLIPFFEAGETAEEIQTERSLSLFTAGSTIKNYFNLPLKSLQSVDRNGALTIKAALRIMNDPKYQPVYFHCAHGADRTGLVAALYRVQNQNWSMIEAYDEMTDKGHNWQHKIFTSSMDRYFIEQNFIGFISDFLN